MSTHPGTGNFIGVWYFAGAVMGRNERTGGAVLKLAEDLAYQGSGQHDMCFDIVLSLESL